MQLIGVNQYGVTIYKVRSGEYFCTANIDNETYLEATIKTKNPNTITIKKLLDTIKKEPPTKPLA